MKALARLTLAALAVVGWPIDSVADAVGVKVEITAACKPNVTPPDPKVSLARKDVLVWSVLSKCTDAQEVRVCPRADDPFYACAGIPGGANIGAQFGGTTAAKPSYVMCTIKSLVIDPNCKATDTCPKFKFQVVNGPAMSVLECPTRCATPASDEKGTTEALSGTEERDPESRLVPCPRGSELVLEVEP